MVARFRTDGNNFLVYIEHFRAFISTMSAMKQVAGVRNWVNTQEKTAHCKSLTIYLTSSGWIHFWNNFDFQYHLTPECCHVRGIRIRYAEHYSDLISSATETHEGQEDLITEKRHDYPINKTKQIDHYYSITKTLTWKWNNKSKLFWNSYLYELI